MSQAALKIYKFPSSNENGVNNQVPVGGGVVMPKLAASSSSDRPARLKPVKSSVKSLAGWFSIFNWLLSLFSGIVTPPQTTTTTTTTTISPSTNKTYNYGCPYGQNGKYCDPCGITSAAINLKIVGGVLATPHSYPAQAMVQFNYQNRVFNSAAGQYLLIDQTYMCGGTLINRNTIVTAAHCVPATVEYEYGGLTYEIPVVTNSLKPTMGSMFTVFLGMEDISGVSLGNLKGGLQMTVSNVYKHPGFDEDKFQNDIAILKLTNEVVLSADIQLACLPDIAQPGYPTQTGTDVYAVGWGTTSSGGNTASLLNNVKLTYYDGSYCDSVLPGTPKNHSTQICAGILAGGKDTCQGDSGGGIYMDGVINGTQKLIAAGIVSYGDACALVNKPGLYTRISAYLLWINQYA